MPNDDVQVDDEKPFVPPRPPDDPGPLTKKDEEEESFSTR